MDEMYTYIGKMVVFVTGSFLIIYVTLAAINGLELIRLHLSFRKRGRGVPKATPSAKEAQRSSKKPSEKCLDEKYVGLCRKCRDYRQPKEGNQL